ncbi:MAG: sulfite exporter TauE/SafE family protein [Roseibacillus sp.]|jgi:uncharacterized membrane protein YfcA|tara:strand:+ start:186 stop:554 length:369 start_codon:yes stop_codon:yes gene_type:complete
MKFVLIGLGIGLAAGLVGALCGVGGGILMVPAFVLALKMKQQHAVATSLAIVVVTAFSGTLNHTLKRPDLIDWKLVACTAVGAAVAAWFGTDLMRNLSNQQLTRFFGILLVLVGVRMLLVKA